MYLEKYTNEEDLYIGNIVQELDEWGEDEDEIKKYALSELNTNRKIRNRILQEKRDKKLTNILESELEKRWIVIDEPYSGRNYSLFSKLAGVRSYGESDSISDERGIPEDASLFYQIKVSQWMGDGHSHSYFTLRELLDYDFSEISPDFSNFVESYRGKDDVDDYRIVFFFDN